MSVSPPRAIALASASALLVLFSMARCAEPVERADAIHHAIEQLEDPSYAVREAATRTLKRSGPGAARAVDEAYDRSTSLEVRRRLDRVRSTLWGSGLVLRLPLNGHARDAGGRRNDGRPVDGTNWTWRGDVPCLDTDAGPSSVVVDDDRDLDTDHAFTLAAWIRPSRIEYERAPDHVGKPGEPIYPWGEGHLRWQGHFIVSKWYSTNAHGDFLFAISPSGHLGLGVANRSKGFRCDAVRTERRIPVGTWTHVAATFDSGKMRLYVDGTLVASKTSEIVRHTELGEYGDDDLHVGRLWWPGYEFHGRIRDLFVFREALDPTRIRDLVAATRP